LHHSVVTVKEDTEIRFITFAQQKEPSFT